MTKLQLTENKYMNDYTSNNLYNTQNAINWVLGEWYKIEDIDKQAIIKQLTQY